MLKGETAEDMVARLSTTGDPSSESVWTFGFGSNMNVALLQSKKGMTVLESSPAVVKEWRLSFAMNAIGLVEPAFADAQPGRKEDAIHGVAVRLPLADYARLSKQEASYAEVEVVAAAYDGRTLEVRMYTKPLPAQMKGGAPPVDIPCSQRYLNVLVSGGVEAGLDKDYIRRLSERPTYAPSPETLARRVAMLPPPETLPPFTVAELCEGYADPPRGSHDPSNVATGAVVRTAVLGYVLELPRPKIFFGSHRGRDVTARQSRQWRGISLDENDDLGAPPFPSLSAMPPDELEFVKHWLDHYLQNATVVGYLVEFREQLERERTERGDNLNAPLVTFP